MISAQAGALLAYLFGITSNEFPNLWLLILLAQLSLIGVLPFLLCVNFEKAMIISESESINSIENHNSLNLVHEGLSLMSMSHSSLKIIPNKID